MPLYEYRCDACGRRFEKIQKFSDPPLETCALCGKGPVQKLLSSPAIQFKGTGWYVTDYAKKGAAGTGETGPSPNGGGSTDKKEKAETTQKPAEKTESKPAGTKASDKS